MNKKLLLSLFLVLNITLNADYIKKEIDAVSIIIDTKTNLIWTDKIVTKKTFDATIKYCNDEVIGHFSKWRTPNYNELISIVDFSKTGTKIDNEFKNINSNLSYWTSTLSKKYYDNNTSDGAYKRVWTINFETGYDSTNYISDAYLSNVICVHDN